MRMRLGMVLVLVWACAAVLHADQPAQSVMQVSLADAIKLAQACNPSAREAAARVAGASAELRSAKAPPNPELAVAHGFGSNTGGFDEDVLLTQTIQLPGKRKPAISAARLGRDAALQDQAGSALDLTFAVQSAYYEALRADEDRQLASDALDVARKFAESAQVQYQAGDVPRSSVVRSEVETSRAEQELGAAETERANRYAVLRSLIGVPESTALALTDKLAFNPVDYNLDDVRARALNNRPDIRAARLERDSLAQSVKAVRAESQPDLFVEARHESLSSSSSGNSIRPGITFPILDLGRHKADVDAAKSALAEQQARLDSRTLQTQVEVENAYHTLEQSRQVVESFQSGRLSRAKDLLDMAQTGFDKGALSYLELVDAQQVYRNEQADYARALADYNIAAADLVRAMGGESK